MKFSRKGTAVTNAVIGILLMGVVYSVSAERGRVKIARGTVVTDRGTLLRGFCSDGNYYSRITQEDVDALAQKFGMNSVHFYINPEDGTGKWNISATDRLVDMCAKANIYLIICYAGWRSEGAGKYVVATADKFWRECAPRYANRTHVLYEIRNEPVAWDFGYNAAAITFFVNEYKYIRSVAPNTHVIMWSSANLGNASGAISTCKSSADQGVDYRNASCGFHWYSASEDNVRKVQAAGYPVINTEFNSNYLGDLTSTGKGAAQWAAQRVVHSEILQISYQYQHGQWIDGVGADPDFTKFMNQYFIPKFSQYLWCPDFGTFPKSPCSTTPVMNDPVTFGSRELHTGFLRSSGLSGITYLLDGKIQRSAHSMPHGAGSIRIAKGATQNRKDVTFSNHVKK